MPVYSGLGGFMSVLVKLSTSLREHVPGYDPINGLQVAVNGTSTPLALAQSLNLPEDEITIIMVNGLHAALDTPVHDGDRVAFFPPVGGG